jgi:hypothetical protein
MTLSRFFRRIRVPVTPGSPAAHRHRERPTLVELDDRSVPTTFTWLGANNGDWSLGTNWDQGTAPNTGADVVINNGTTPAFNTTVEINTLTVGATSALAVNGGTLTIDAASTVGGALTINSGGTLTANAALHIVGSLTQAGDGGTLSGTGDVTIDGLFTWDGGFQTGGGRTVPNGGMLCQGGLGTMTLKDGRHLDNNGTAICSGNSFALQNGAVFTNNGTVDFQGDVSIGAGFPAGAESAFINSGTFKKTAGTGSASTIGVPFNMPLATAGKVDVRTGTLTLRGGGTSVRPWTVAAGATLDFADGTWNLNPGSTVNAPPAAAAGAVLFEGGTVTFADTYAVGDTAFRFGGRANFNATSSTTTLTFGGGDNNVLGGSGAFTVNGLLTWGSGKITGSGPTLPLFTVNGDITLAIQGGTSGLDHRQLDFAANHTATWLNGSQSLPLTNGAAFNNNGTFVVQSNAALALSNATFTNNGTFTVQSNFDLVFSSGAGIDNSGVFDAQGNVRFFIGTGTVAGFHNKNNGIFRKSVGTGITTVNIPFTNDGTVDLQTGTTDFLVGGTSTGPWTVAAAAALEFVDSAGTWNLNTGSTVSGGGTVRFLGGTVNLADTYSVDHTLIGGLFGVAVGGAVANFNATSTTSTLELDGFFGGTLGGAGNFTITGFFTWTGGLMTGAGTTTASGGANLGSVSSVTLDGRRFDNTGTATWTGSNISFNHGAVFNNNGTFEARTDSGISDAAITGGGPLSVFNNNGTFKKFAGTGTVTAVSVQFTNAGIIDVQTGTLSLTSGLTNFPAASAAGISGANGATESGTTVTITTQQSHEPVVVGQAVTISGVGEAGYNGTFIVTAVPSSTTFQYTAPTSGLPASGNGDATFLSSSTLTGGTYLVSGTLQFTGANIVTNAATVVLNGPAAAILNSSTGTDSLAHFTTNAAGGSFTVQNGGTLTVPMPGTVLGNFNPGSLGRLIGIAFDPATGDIFVYQSRDATITELSPTGTVVGTIPLPCNPSEDFNLDFVPESITVGGNIVPAGSLIAVNGGDSPQTIYYLDKTTGAVLASVTLAQAGGNGSSEVAYSLQRHTIFTIDFTNGRVRENDPATGADLNSFPVAPAGSPSFSLFFADIEVSRASGNIFLVSNEQNRIREMTPDGAFVRDLDVSGFSLGGMIGIALDDATGETWITNVNGDVLHLSEFAFANAGSVTVGSGSTFTAGGGSKYKQTAGTSTVNGTLVATAADIQGGLLQGSGTVNGDLTNAAQVRVGGSPGLFTINGGYTQTDTGSLEVEIGGPAAGSQFDQLVVAGPATFDGAVNVSRLGGFVPAGPDAFRIVSAGSRTGTFATLNGSGFPGGRFVLLEDATGTVLDTNLAPTPADDVSTTVEGHAVTTNVVANDTDPDGDSLTIVAVTVSTQGVTPVNNGDGTITYDPPTGFLGTDAYTYTVRDALGNGATATVTVAVTPVNHAPTLDPIADPAAIPEDSGAQTIDLTGITAGSGDDQSLTVTATSSNAGLIPNPTVNYASPSDTGSLRYTPVPNQNGTAFITVTVKDNGGTAFGGVDTITRTFTVTVDAVPDAPAIDTALVPMLPAVPLKPAPTSPAGAPVADLLAGVTDADGDPLGLTVSGIDNRKGAWQFSIDGGATWAPVPVTVSPTAALVPSNDPDTRVRFLPNRGFQGFASFSFRAWDRSDGATEGTQVDPTLAPAAYSARTERAWVAIGKTSPAVNAAGATLLPAVREDGKSSRTLTVKSLLGIAGLESPTGNPGIAVTGLGGSGGRWQFRLAGARAFVDAGAVSDHSALLLRPTDAVRFVPDANADGQEALTFKTWDQVGTAGTNVDPAGPGFGTDPGSAVLDITAVNDAPVLDLSVPAVLRPVDPGQTTDERPFASLMAATDIDGPATGVAVVGATGRGWEFNTGGGWTPLGAVSSGKALLLNTDARIRLVAPADAKPGTATLSFKAWDRFAGSGAVGTRIPVRGTAFSKQTEIATAAIGNVAPVLDTTRDVTLPTVQSGSTKPNEGTLVKSLLGAAVTDAPGSLRGIALVFADNANGRWQYALGGNVFVDVGPVGPGSALLLADSNKLRFVPNAGFIGQATIRFVAWDRTTGQAGDRIDTGPPLNSFSLEVETATVTVV